MTLLSRKADYALLIFAYLAERPEGANGRAIAERYGLSRSFVANILKELAHKGYLESHRGVKGGYTLCKPLREVSLAELLESIDERFQLTVCSSHTGSGECSVESACPVKTPLAAIHQRLTSVLRDVTLADLFQRHEPATAARTLLPLLTLTETPA